MTDLNLPDPQKASGAYAARQIKRDRQAGGDARDIAARLSLAGTLRRDLHALVGGDRMIGETLVRLRNEAGKEGPLAQAAEAAIDERRQIAAELLKIAADAGVTLHLRTAEMSGLDRAMLGIGATA